MIGTNPGDRKRGRLSQQEREFVVRNMRSMTIDEIALKLNRHKHTIESHIKAVVSNEVPDHLAYELENRSFWASIQKQFNEAELKMFKADWARTIKQFGDDVTHTEEKQIVQSCSLTILMYRCLEEIQKTKEKLEQLEQFYKNELSKETKNTEILMSLDNQLASMRIATTSLTNQYDKLFRDQQVLQKDLKATRDQRISKLESSQTTFLEWLAWLQNPENLVEVSQEIELKRVAMYKAYLLDGAQLHRFNDNVLDSPILNAETVELIPAIAEVERKLSGKEI